MADSTLTAIRNKVRRLTRSPSLAQLTDADLDQYINTFVLYDFPEHLRQFALKTTFTFVANPFQDVYPTDTISFGGVTTNQLYDFQNKYLTIHDPVYIAGFKAMFTQSRSEFFGIYPFVNSIASIGTLGDGITTTFTGTINIQFAFLLPNQVNQSATLLQNNVLFDSIGNNKEGLSLVDVPVLNTTTGNPSVIGNLYAPGSTPATPPTIVDPTNNINYTTGAFTITFPSAPGAGQNINSQTVPTVVALPVSMLFYDNKFTLRPVPDQPYRVNFEAYIRPTELLATNQNPNLNEWWQYISYGAAKKVFEDRMDMESVAQITPEFTKQQLLVLRRTIVQKTNERVATIYTDSANPGGYNGWGWGSGTGGPF